MAEHAMDKFYQIKVCRAPLPYNSLLLFPRPL